MPKRNSTANRRGSAIRDFGGLKVRIPEFYTSSGGEGVLEDWATDGTPTLR